MASTLLSGKEGNRVVNALTAALSTAEMKSLLLNHLAASPDSLRQLGNWERSPFRGAVQWARQEGRIPELIRVAHALNPHTRPLAQLYADLESGIFPCPPRDWDCTDLDAYGLPFAVREPANVAKRTPQEWQKLFQPPQNLFQDLSDLSEHTVIIAPAGCGKTAVLEYNASRCWPSTPGRKILPVRFGCNAITRMIRNCGTNPNYIPDPRDFIASACKEAVNIIDKSKKPLPRRNNHALYEMHTMQRRLLKKSRAVHQRGSGRQSAQRVPTQEALLAELNEYLQECGFDKLVILVDELAPAMEELRIGGIKPLNALRPIVRAISTVEVKWLTVMLFIPAALEPLLAVALVGLPDDVQKIRLPWTADDLKHMLNRYLARWVELQEPPTIHKELEQRCESGRVEWSKIPQNIVDDLVLNADGRPEIALRLAEKLIMRHCNDERGRPQISWAVWEQVRTEHADRLRTKFNRFDQDVQKAATTILRDS